MKRIIAIIAVGATTALMQVNAQETETTEKETYPEAREEVIDERAQPSADYQHNQYGTYPQGIDSTVLAQTRVEINKSDLPEEVRTSFESSEYSDQEIVAIYKVVHSPNLEKQATIEEPNNDPTYHNELNERSRMESMNTADEEVALSETETTLDQSPEEGNSIEKRSSDTEMNTTNTFSESETVPVMYEIEVKGEDSNTTLTYTEEGELEEASEEASM